MTTPYNRLRAGARDFWGDIQWSRTLAPGVLAVSTAGHGGIVVDPSVFPIAECLRDGIDGYILRWTYTRSGEEANRVLGFEEDCGWAALLTHHPELYARAIKKGYMVSTEAELRKHAYRSLSEYYPTHIGHAR